MSKKRSTENGNAETQKNKKKQKKGSEVVKERRYRFKNFNERIEDIDISSIQNIGGYRGPGPQSTDSTWFELSLNEWKELNCSAAFAKFCYAVTPMTGTLAKLLFNKEKIVSEIFSVLKRANEEGPESSARLALVPVLSLTAMLAKDLGSEFQCHFSEFYGLLLPILPSAADPEIIEAAFASLLYVFKCLLNDLLNDLPGTFEVVAKPLLEFSDSNGHLRKFGAECFSYLLRKSLKISESGFFEGVENFCNVKLKEFVADTFVAAILDDSTGRFRTCLKPLYLEIFGYLEKKKSPIWLDIFRFLSVKLLDETDQNTNAPLWKILIQSLEVTDSSQVLTVVLIDMFAYRRGTRVQFHSLLLPGLLKFESIELCAHFLRSMNLESTLQNRQMTLKYIEKVLKGEISNLIILSKWLVKLNWIHYDLILADIVCTAISKAPEKEDELVLELLQVILPKYSNATSSLNSVLKVFDILKNSILKDSKLALKILIEHFPKKFPESLRPHFLKTFQGFIKSETIPPRDDFIICTQVIENYELKKAEYLFESNDLINFIKEDRLKYPEQLKAVRVVLRNRDIDQSVISALTSTLSKCLRSHSSEWRYESIELLELLYSRDQTTLEIITILKSIEIVPNDLENYREKLLKLKKLEHLKKVNGDNVTFILNYLIGFLQVKLTLLWSEGNRILSKFSTSNLKEFNEILFEIFTKKYENIIEQKIDNESKVETDSSYDFDIDDDGLNNLKHIRRGIEEVRGITDDKHEEFISETFIPVLVTSNILPSILKLFAAHPETCLDEFRETIFIPLIIETFKKEKENSNDFFGVFIEKNLNFVLQTLAGVKLDKVSRISELETVLLRFLAHGDLQLQNRALDAIFNTRKYGAALSSQWKGRLKNLLNDNLFREELTCLTSESESLPRVVHWHGLLAPLIVRILFGRFIARKGASAGRHSLPLRRKMIMNCFGTWDEGSLALIVDFLLESKGDSSSSRQQLGFLNVLGDVFGSLGRKLDEQSMNRLIGTLISLGDRGVEDIIDDQGDNLEDDQYGNEHENDLDNNTDNDNTSDLLNDPDAKRIRQLVMKRFLQLFKIFESNVIKRLSPFLPDLFDKILNPRILQLSTHFTQSSNSSALLEILICISQNLSEEDLIKVLLELSPQIWNKSVEAFANESTKPLIVSQLLTVFEGIILRKTSKTTTATPSILLQSIVIPGIEPLLDAFDLRLKNSSQANSQNILRIVTMTQVLAPHVTSPEQASRLCKTFEGLLRIKTIFESIRTHLINSMSELLLKSQNGQITKSLFEISSVQWNVLKSRPGREALCNLFDCFAQLNPENSEFIYLASIFRDLNAWLPGKLGEPDFDLRLAAFAKLRKSIDSNEIGNNQQELDAFIPVTWSMIYFLQDVDELSIRNQSFGVLKSLIKKLLEREINTVDDDIVMAYTDETDETEEVSNTVEQLDDENDPLEGDLVNPAIVTACSAPWLIQRIILPSIKIGLKSRQEVIRIEFVALLDLLISTFPQRTPFASLFALIRPIESSEDVEVDLDEENIFRNIYHIQEPRRNRAIRQIGEMALNGRLVGLTRGIIEDLLLPLVISTTLPDPKGEIEFTVSEAMQKDSIVTCGALMAQLPWKVFVRKLSQFVKEISENKRSELWNKAVLRLLPAMISQFKAVEAADEEFAKKINEDVLPSMFRLLHKSESASEAADLAKQAKKAKTSSGAPLGVDKIAVKHSLRVPIAISIGQLIKIVSRGSLDAPVVLSHLPKLLTDLLNVLKQKDADTRDVARGALVKIMGTFGTAFLPFLLREARTLLNRGYQRHVLTFTAHAILVEFLRRQKQEEYAQEDWNLDASADLLVDMALASSFGFQAAERATIEWSGKQPEVRAAKGPEIVALTAQFTSQPVLEKVLIAKIIKIALLEIDDGSAGLLNTRGTGALDEKAEAISKIEGEAFENLLRALFLNGLYPLLTREPERLPALLASMHEILSLPCDSGSKSHLHRLQARTFEFLSHVLNNFKNNEESDQVFMGRIAPFVGLTREYILEKGKHVVALTAAIALFNQFISFKSLHASISDLQPLLQKLFTIILKGNSGSSEGSAQLAAAYKLTSTLIRDWSDLEVTDTQIKALIEYTRLQLENTHQQSLTFSLIRSLISRQIVLLQLFELMETVRTVMLTSHQPATRQQCRSAYIHFLTNYPMATKKLEEQLDFLLANVRYEFATGRESCIEVMSGLIGKLPVEVIENVAEAWFVGLAVQLAKENSVDGSVEVSQTILRTIYLLFTRLPQGKRRDNLELLLIRWITQSPKLSVQGAAWKLFLPILKEVSSDSRNVLLEKVVELMADDSTPEDLLRIVLKAAEESIKEDLCPGEILTEIAEKGSDKRFFKEDCDFQIRHSIALLWNTILD